MARIRTIKPEFFTSEDIVSLSPLARLLYIAVWCEADKEGRLPWKPMTFKLRYFPGDNCDIQALCKELVDAGLVKLYGNGLACIPQFSKHQHVNPRESASVLPPPDATLDSTRHDASPRVNSEIDPQVGREGKGKEGNTEPNGSGGKPPMTPDEIIFGYGVPILVNAGSTDKAARSFLGGLRKGHGADALVNALRDCLREKPLQPLEWLAAALPPATAAGKPNRQEAIEQRNREAAERWADQGETNVAH